MKDMEIGLIKIEINDMIFMWFATLQVNDTKEEITTFYIMWEEIHSQFVILFQNIWG